jgi:tetratricopeptide (TPR) repeat protein
VYYSQKNYGWALYNFQQTLDIEEKTLPTNHPNYAVIYNNIADVYAAQEKYDQALINYHKELEIRLITLEPNYSDLAMTYQNLSIMYYKLKKFDDAFKMNEMARKTIIEYLSPNNI